MEFIDRPTKLNSNKALGDHVFEYSYRVIKKNFLRTQDIKYVVLLFANAPTITHKLIDKGINILKKNKKFDLQLQHQFIICESSKSKKIDKTVLLNHLLDLSILGIKNT